MDKAKITPSLILWGYCPRSGQRLFALNETAEARGELFKTSDFPNGEGLLGKIRSPIHQYIKWGDRSVFLTQVDIAIFLKSECKNMKIAFCSLEKIKIKAGLAHEGGTYKPFDPVLASMVTIFEAFGPDNPENA